MKPNSPVQNSLVRAAGCLAILIMISTVGCVDGSSSQADNGGIGGTGVSDGSVDAFGSIFVNGVEWDVSRAQIRIDGAPAVEADLRLGMKVRVIGDITASGLTGDATRVVHDTAILGPIEATPVLSLEGQEKTFTILGRTVIVGSQSTTFDGGASFEGLAIDQALRVSGYAASDSTLTATRVFLGGLFPAANFAGLNGNVTNLQKNPDGTGIFDVDAITIRYSPATSFTEMSLEELSDGDYVDVWGNLDLSGTEIEATEVEFLEEELAQEDVEDFEITGVVSDFVSISDFVVGGFSVDASDANEEPTGLVITNGLVVEIEGTLEAGVLRATEVELDEDGSQSGGEAKLEASATSVDASLRELVILGVTVRADGDTRIKDERDGDTNFAFDEIQALDWLKIEGWQIAPGVVVAGQITRTAVDSDVVLFGPVTALDVDVPMLEVIDQVVPLSGLTTYSNESGMVRTEEEFFRNPGDVILDDIVEVIDSGAIDPTVLAEADEVALDD